jgi:hypothetical protein
VRSTPVRVSGVSEEWLSAREAAASGRAARARGRTPQGPSTPSAHAHELGEAGSDQKSQQLAVVQIRKHAGSLFGDRRRWEPRL